MDGIQEFFYLLLGLAGFVFLFLAAFHLTGYLLKGAALSRMAQNAGLPNPALAWVPVVNNYLLGTLCDRAVYHQKGKRRGFAILLPVWDVLGIFFGRNLFAFLSYYNGLDTRFMGGETFFSLHKADPMDLFETLVAAGLLASFACALWHLYRDYDPGRAVLFTVLSVIFGSFVQGILLFVLRSQVPVSARGGMPPSPEVFSGISAPMPPPPPPGNCSPPEEPAAGWYQPQQLYQQPYRSPPPRKKGPEQ